MKVLDLQCSHHHSFEGWFASLDDFESQLARDLVACPLCADTAITKKLSAPRLNLNTSRGDRETSTNASSAATAQNAEGASFGPTNQASEASVAALPGAHEVANLEPAQLQAALLKMVRHVVANTEDVGQNFSEEARKIHYGEAQQRNIRGQATPEETEALIDEGIQVMPLPLPEAFKGPLQ